MLAEYGFSLYPLAMKNVGAIIVSYNAGAELERLAVAIAPQVETVLVVDNGSHAPTLQRLQRMEDRIPNLHLECLPKNIGLAKAQNIGIRAICDEGMEWALLLDDDSLPAENMIEAMLSASIEPQATILAPHISEADTAQEYQYIQAKKW